MDFDRPEHSPTSDTFEQLVARRLSRRDLFRVGVVVGGAAAVAGIAGPAAALPSPASPPAGRPGPVGRDNAFRLPITPVDPPAPAPFDSPVVAAGYTHDVVIRWGDDVFPGGTPFDVDTQTAALQQRRFGFNADYTAYFPQRRNDNGTKRGTEGLLWVNHEYTDGRMMFRGYDPAAPTREQVDIELAAHGGTLVRIEQGRDGVWRHVPHRDNFRVTATTPMTLTGPVAGDPRVTTTADPTGRAVLGMLNNCGGGVTPWGTLLTAEENFDQYFANAAAVTDPRAKEANARFGIPAGASERKWERFYPRFDLAQEPNEPNRFGWIVEIDPYDPRATPKKRTAMGRFKHEAAAGTTTADGRWAVYSGDDSRFEFVYKFVTRDRVNRNDRRNADLLDSGTLYVARFAADGSGEWLPLVAGQGPLTPANGFATQADVLLHTRQAATLLGATPMDRPEDIEPNPVTGSVYIALTNNTRRTEAQEDAANPRSANAAGHVIELVEDGKDAAATRFAWNILLLAGDRTTPEARYGTFSPDQVSELACPDNLAVDSLGQLWIATDGAPGVLGTMNDAVLGLTVTGPERGRTQQVFGGVYGSEMTGVFFNATETTMFASVQHPGEGGTLAAPTSNWPDGGSSVPRSSVVAIRRA